MPNTTNSGSTGRLETLDWLERIAVIILRRLSQSACKGKIDRKNVLEVSFSLPKDLNSSSPGAEYSAMGLKQAWRQAAQLMRRIQNRAAFHARVLGFQGYIREAPAAGISFTVPQAPEEKPPEPVLNRQALCTGGLLWRTRQPRRIPYKFHVSEIFLRFGTYKQAFVLVRSTIFACWFESVKHEVSQLHLAVSTKRSASPNPCKD
jgi:hypothetical protein